MSAEFYFLIYDIDLYQKASSKQNMLEQQNSQSQHVLDCIYFNVK
jgi:hypothetical protein